MLGVAAVVVLVAGLLGLLAASVLTHARAQAAADLAALAGAERLQHQVLFSTGAAAGAVDPAGPDGAPCAIAGVVAQRNRGRSTACETGASGTVTVEVTVDGPLAAARARARAGPSSPTVDSWSSSTAGS